MEQVRPGDVKSPESRSRFLAGLEPSLFGTVGGNTPCISIGTDNPLELAVFDSGSGIREMGAAMVHADPRPDRYHIFFSHFHWDHLQGLPFFGPAYDSSVKIDFYSPMDNPEAALQGQMTGPYFPIRMDAMTSQKAFHRMTGKVAIGSLEISYKKMNHPGDSYSFLVNEGKNRFIYATDTELSAADFVRNDENAAFFEHIDVIVLDSQYTQGEATEKYNWGHNAFSRAVDFAAAWGIRRLILFHHDPSYDDTMLNDNLHSARRYAKNMGMRGVEISLAVEGMELTL
ncbi:MAG: MBL fold metallo-hydrolase [Spirochaetaceae bacterium]|nr:MBL fold metallo-hydrolase [Spirochaetaceae bacterium]